MTDLDEIVPSLETIPNLDGELATAKESSMPEVIDQLLATADFEIDLSPG